MAAAFNNNGQGVRGDMVATITAVLLDPEARANDNGGNDQVTDGHLQEPALFIAGMVRAFGGQMNDQNYYRVRPGEHGPGHLRLAERIQLLLAELRGPGHNAAGTRV